MAKVKVKKQSTFIDMTAMSDVTVLLLTFFMLTSTFISKEPIQVTTPSSVSEFKVPESNLMTILVDQNGKIFMSLDNQKTMAATLKAVGEDYGIQFTDKQLGAFQRLTSFGVPIRWMEAFLDRSTEDQDKYLRDIESKRVGIPTDTIEVKDALGLVSSDNEFKRWVTHATRLHSEMMKKDNPDAQNTDLQIAIKSDKGTAYPTVKKVMDDLRDMRKNRYLLITSLKTASSE
ncbi:MAG: biopolymer transporter ExbD [Dysgonamonadaceae bacterium]|jgi:biopolymer transport protein ExbD|nr:biopolymer transporter ExbD [Dysgonamonadaceae bacterium]